MVDKNLNKRWLENLNHEVVKDAIGVTLCPYLIALEGWRRGLTVRWYVNSTEKTNIKTLGSPRLTSRVFSLTLNDKTHFFFRSRGDQVSTDAVEICNDKAETKKLLIDNGVPTPVGKNFSIEENTEKEIYEYALSLGFPLVVKPLRGSLGKGVIANIKDEEELKGALNYIIHELKYMNIIVEKFFEGEEYRVYVIGDKVVGAVKKIPPYIIGNGVSTIKELIAEKNKNRKKNPHLSKKPLKIDYEVMQCIEEEGYSLGSVLEEGKQIYLRKQNSLSSGGEPVDATDELSDYVKKVSVDAVKSIPNLIQGGLDVIVNKTTDEAVVIEINSTAVIGSHLFPEIGQARDIPSAIVDYYFPETQNVEKTNLYFDFKSVKEAFRSKSVHELEIVPAPKGKLYSKKYIVSGKVQKVGYRKWIRKNALKLGLHGYAENLPNGKVAILVASPDKKLVDNFKEICLEGPEKAEVKHISEKEWDKPVKIGFEVKANKAKPVKKANELQQKYDDLLKEKKKIEKQLQYIQNSRSWKITKPMRNILNALK